MSGYTEVKGSIIAMMMVQFITVTN